MNSLTLTTTTFFNTTLSTISSTKEQVILQFVLFIKRNTDWCVETFIGSVVNGQVGDFLDTKLGSGSKQVAIQTILLVDSIHSWIKRRRNRQENFVMVDWKFSDDEYVFVEEDINNSYLELSEIFFN